MLRILLAAAVAVGLAGCSEPAPVVMATPGGQILRGTTTMPGFGSVDFTVSDSTRTCTGHFEPAIMSKIVLVTASCSDGSVGVGRALREGPLSGSGWIRMNDGAYATFVYGATAAGI